MITAEFDSPAKVNLFLSVGNRRADGFHEVITVLQKISLCDRITLEATEQPGIEIICSHTGVPKDASNLVHRAITEYCRAVGRDLTKSGYRVSINKQIPVSGGMGGGSSNAGCVLKELNRADGFPLTQNELVAIAASLGSDVPFFLYEDQAMLGTGKGELLVPCDSLPPCRMEFAVCGIKQSTGAMYSSLDKMREAAPQEYEAPTVTNILQALKDGLLKNVCKHIHNSFEPVFEALNSNASPSFSSVKAEMSSRGALAVFLCGSGPTVCGIFEK